MPPVVCSDVYNPEASNKYDMEKTIQPRCSMSGIFTYIYPKNCPNVGKYSIHGASGQYSHHPEVIKIFICFYPVAAMSEILMDILDLGKS